LVSVAVVEEADAIENTEMKMLTVNATADALSCFVRLILSEHRIVIL